MKLALSDWRDLILVAEYGRKGERLRDLARPFGEDPDRCSPFMSISLLVLLACGTFGCSNLGGENIRNDCGASQGAPPYSHDPSSERAPSTWKTGASWSFVALDKRDSIAQSFVFRVSDEPQDTCMSGDWKKLEVVSGAASELSSPAYMIEGRNLQILLSTDLCDAYPMYSGVLTEQGFTGLHVFEHMMGGEQYGKVFGVPIRGSR